MIKEEFKINFAKSIDEYVGSVLILLGVLFGIFRRSNSVPDNVQKILFIKFWGIGSIVLSEPALRWLKRRYPQADLHYLTLSQNKQLFHMLPMVSKVHVLPFANPMSFLLKSVALVRQLRLEKYDMIFDAEFFTHFSALIARATAGCEVTGFARPHGLKKHILHKNIPFHHDRHTAEQFLNLVQKDSTARKDAIVPKLYLEENGLHISSFDLKSKSYIVLNINASPLAIERRWSRDRFVKLATALLNGFDFDLVLIGTISEADYVKLVEERLKYSRRVKNMAGQLNLIELAYILNNAAMLVSNDSGPIHMASAFQVPVVGFYGPETPKRYGPLSRKKLVFYLNLWCSPCMSVDNAKTVNCINNLACMENLEVDYVIREVNRFIKLQLNQSSKNYRPAR